MNTGGYDSAGIALINDNDNLNLYKSKGKVADLIHFAEKNDVSGTIGIAHTRWATVIGIGENEYFLASDATPIIEHTNKVIYIDDEDIVTIERDKNLIIKTIANVEKTPEIKKLEMTISQLEKNGYPHFILKEIFEQQDH